MFFNSAGLDKNKSDVQALIASYKTWLQNGITSGIVFNAKGSAKSMDYLTNGKKEINTALADMEIFKQQLDYVAIVEQAIGGRVPVLPKSKSGFGLGL